MCFLLQDLLAAEEMPTNSCLAASGREVTSRREAVPIWFASETGKRLRAASGHLVYKGATVWRLFIMEVESESWIHLQRVCVRACVRVF